MRWNRNLNKMEIQAQEDKEMVTNNDSRQGGEYEYKGLSTDAKPTDCKVNSLFLELDTGDVYYFTGETWAKVGG